VNGHSTYTYATGDLLEERNSYTYTHCHGDVFFADWREARAQVLQGLAEPADPPVPVGQVALATALEADIRCTADMLESLMGSLLRQETGELVRDTLARLVGRFEVAKRVHSHYLARWRATPEASYRDLALYLRYAEVMELAYSLTGEVVYLNVLLKVLDTLAARVADLPVDQSGRLARLLGREQIHVDQMLGPPE
jgi:methionyl-tRNA formyltransferase